MSEKVYPVMKMKTGSISVAVFDGQYGRNVVLQRSIYNKKTQNTRYEKMTLLLTNCLDAAYLLTKALDWHLTNPEPEREQQTPSEKTKDDSIPF